MQLRCLPYYKGFIKFLYINQVYCNSTQAQEFSSGEGGPKAQLTGKSSDSVNLVLNLFSRGGPMVYFKKNYNFPRFHGG